MPACKRSWSGIVPRHTTQENTIRDPGLLCPQLWSIKKWRIIETPMFITCHRGRQASGTGKMKNNINDYDQQLTGIHDHGLRCEGIQAMFACSITSRCQPIRLGRRNMSSPWENQRWFVTAVGKKLASKPAKLRIISASIWLPNKQAHQFLQPDIGVQLFFNSPSICLETISKWTDLTSCLKWIYTCYRIQTATFRTADVLS